MSPHAEEEEAVATTEHAGTSEAEGQAGETHVQGDSGAAAMEVDAAAAAVAPASSASEPAPSDPRASPPFDGMSPFSPEPVSSTVAVAAGASSPAPLSLRLGRPSDAVELSSFAREALLRAFGPPRNTQENIDAYLSSAYSAEIQAAELANPALQVFLAERAGSIVGFAMVRQGEVDPAVEDKTAVELQRLYGVGVGAALMDRCLEHALWLGKRTVWLGVWDRNERAQAFYKRYGFVDVGSHPFTFGQEQQIHRVMQRSVDPLHPPEPFPTPPALAAAAGAVTAFQPLPAETPLRERVLDAFTRAPLERPADALERQSGCSVLQVTCWLRVAEAQVAEVAAALVVEGLLVATIDATHFKRVQ